MATTQQDSLFSLTGRTIVVAGASRGIGYGLANALAGAGASVVGFGRTKGIKSDHFDYVSCDLNDARAVLDLIARVDTELPPISCYLHVAGTTAPSTELLQPVEIFNRLLNDNLSNAYRCCAEVGRRMAARGHGSIITVTSIGSMLGFPGNPGYVASKGGLRMMSKALALDLGPSGVRVNCIVPGYIQTDMTAASYNDAELHRQRADRTMLGRWGKVEELAGAAIFLASDASTYVTGSDVFVDGGWASKGL